MAVKINVEKYLGIKRPIEIKGTVKNTRKVYSMQLKLAKMNKTIQANDPENNSEKFDEDKMIAMLESMSDILTECESFVLEILNLSSKYISKLDELSQEELIGLVTQITDVFMGVKSEKVDESKKELGKLSTN